MLKPVEVEQSFDGERLVRQEALKQMEAGAACGDLG